MHYSLEQIEQAIRTTRLRFLRSAGLAAVIGMGLLYVLSKSFQEELSISSFLFLGFIIGFFIAGIILPQGFRAQLPKS